MGQSRARSGRECDTLTHVRNPGEPQANANGAAACGRGPGYPKEARYHGVTVTACQPHWYMNVQGDG